MAIIGNPYIANASAKMNTDELIQAIRVDIINEYEAIIGYEAHAAATIDEKAKKVFYHIAEQEKSHLGES